MSKIPVSTIPACLINESMSAAPRTNEPKVGMLATYCIGSDRYAYVVCKVFSNRRILALPIYSFPEEGERPVKLIDGVEYWSEDTEKFYKEEMASQVPEMDDPMFPWYNARFWSEHTYTLRKNGRWVKQGVNLWSGGGIHLGYADPYCDPCLETRITVIY